MAGRLSRWYMAAFIVGFLYVLSWVFMAGFGGSVVQVDFSMYPELEGMEMVVAVQEGESLRAELFRRGPTRLTGVKVPLGTHRLWIEHPDHPSDTVVVEAALRGAQYLFYAFHRSDWVDGARVRRVGVDDDLPD